MMLKFEDVYAFLKVSDSKAFSRAAYQLCLSKSVVSHRVARLERDLGTRLLARTSRGVSLTDAGAVFLSQCREIIDQLELARQTLPREGSALTGGLRISMPLDFGLRCMTEPLARFMAQNPALDCTADYSDDCVDLDSGSFDLALRLGRQSSLSSKITIVTSIESVVVGTPELIEQVGLPTHPTELQTLPCLTYSGLTDVSLWHFWLGRRRTPVSVHGRFRANSMQALLVAAYAGLGFATMPMRFVEDDLREGRLRQVLSGYRAFDLVIGAHYPSGNRASRSAAAFVDFLRKEFAAQDPAIAALAH